MPDILAIVSRAVFERDALTADGALVSPGEVWATDRYVSVHRAFEPLTDGGRIFLVTVRPPAERMWIVGLLDSPRFEDGAWVATGPNRHAVTDVSGLRSMIRFASGRSLPEAEGTLAMSLQSPRALDAASAHAIAARVGPPRAVPPAARAERAPAADAEEPDVRAGREAALGAALEEYVVLYDRMQETHGLPMPEGLKGEGPEAKLRVRFESVTRTVLAKFVERDDAFSPS